MCVHMDSVIFISKDCPQSPILNVILVKVKSFSRVRLCDPMDCVAYQVSLSMGFSRQDYWSGLPFASPGDIPDPGIEPRSPASNPNPL